ncbi:MAG: SDR family NAD(P)-dependent oxidoreductase [Paracoccaceae bacterium]
MTDRTKPNLAAKPVALVTGASRGLGYAMAAALGASGWHVMAVARTTGGLEELDDEIQRAGGSATLAPLDINDDKAIEHLANSVAGRWGGLQMWIHCAVHAPPMAPAGHLDMKDFDKSATTNLRATAQLIPLMEPLLRAGHGTAVFLDDPQGGAKFFGAYGATKAAQIQLAKSWQAETVNTGPKVRILTPRPVATATRARFYPGEDRAHLADIGAEARRLIAEI